MPKIKENKRGIISWNEAERMINSCNDLEEQSLIAFLYMSGARISEVLALKRKNFWSDYQFLNVRIITLKRKGNILHERTLFFDLNKTPFIDPLIDYLNSIQLRESKVWDWTRVKAWRLIKRLEPSAWLHLFRHTRATLLAEKGATESQLIAWFGWTDGRPTQEYIQKSEKLTKPLADLLVD